MKQKTKQIPKPLKFYNVVKKRQHKKELIEAIITEYKHPQKLTLNKKAFIYEPTDKETRQYLKDLTKLSYKEILEIGQINKNKKTNKIKVTFKETWRLLKKNKALIVRIYNKNLTYSDTITSRHSRFIKIHNKKYLIVPNTGLYDNRRQMYVYSYYEDNPFPIEFKDDRVATNPDTEFLENTLHFEFAQKMAQMNEIRKKIDLTFLFSILSFMSGVGSILIGLVIAHHLNIF